MTFDYDLLAIGAGVGGTSAARKAAALGARVAIAEQEDIGGTCVNRGCIPKKLIVYAADFALQDRAASSYGWSDCQRQLNWSKLMQAVHQHVESLKQSYLQKLKTEGVEQFRGHATLVDAHTVEVDGRKVTADKILIAVGGKPAKPKVPGIEHVITSREMFQLQQLPKRLAIVGGGYIGVEFSSMMNALGVQVTLLDTHELILEGFDHDIRSAVQAGLSKREIRVLNKTTAEEIEQGQEGLQLKLSGHEETLTVDTILMATGRVPETESLGLEAAGVEVGEKGAIKVDEYSRTSQSNIFAVGDCTNRVPLTPVARAEGRAFACTVFGQPQKLSYDYVPSAVFARPEAASVGMTEAKAREKFGDVQIYHTQFEPLFYSLTEQDERAMLKLVVDEKDKVLGVHMVGEHAAEIVQSLAVAVRQGVTKDDLDATIGIHPTTGEEFLTLD